LTSKRLLKKFKLADVDKDGIPAGEDPDDVWEMGFRLQMGYEHSVMTTRHDICRNFAEQPG